MICSRCQGLIINDAGDVRCLNCGERPSFKYVVPADERMDPARERLSYVKYDKDLKRKPKARHV